MLTISDFSDISNKMSFDVAYGDSVIKSLFANKINLSGTINKLSVLQDSSNSKFGILDNSALEIFNNQGNLVNTINSFSAFKPATFTDGGYTFFVGSDSSKLNLYVEHNGLLQINSGVQLVSKASAPPVIRSLQPNQYQAIIGAANGKIYIYNIPNPPVALPKLQDSISVFQNPIKKITVDGNYFSAISGDMFYDSNGNQVSLGSTGMDIAID